MVTAGCWERDNNLLNNNNRQFNYWYKLVECHIRTWFREVMSPYYQQLLLGTVCSGPLEKRGYSWLELVEIQDFQSRGNSDILKFSFILNQNKKSKFWHFPQSCFDKIKVFHLQYIETKSLNEVLRPYINNALGDFSWEKFQPPLKCALHPAVWNCSRPMHTRELFIWQQNSPYGELLHSTLKQCRFISHVISARVHMHLVWVTQELVPKYGCTSRSQ